MTVLYEKKVLSRNDEVAAEVRDRLAARGVFALNLIGSPGSGKTSLIERTADWINARTQAAALSGDQATENDARRIRAAGLPALQITTGAECHLNARRVLDVLDRPELAEARVLFIENVGNLICPASYDLGEATKVALLSVPEGDDKPLKYPGLFQRSDLAIINKIDLLEFTNFDLDVATANLKEVAPHLDVLALSCRSGAGLDGWYCWLGDHVGARLC